MSAADDLQRLGIGIGNRPARALRLEQRAHRAVDKSLARLGVERIDVYFSHWPDTGTPYEETLAVYEELRVMGKKRAAGASNLNAIQLSDALAVGRERGLPRYEVL